MTTRRRNADTGRGEKDVLFVSVSHPSQLRQRDTQKAIKQHVMRDIGRSRRKRSRPVTVPFDIPEGCFRGIVESETHQSLLSIPLTIEAYGYFAVQPDARARQLLHFSETLFACLEMSIVKSRTDAHGLLIVHGMADQAYRPFKMEWYALAIADACAFYLCLANGAMFFHQMTEQGGYEYTDYDESAKYFSQCTGMMARRLGCEKESVSAGVITTVLGFVCHDAAVRKWDRWRIHMDGLERILQLRGGFSGLSALLHLFAFWFDLVGCAIHDRSPRFGVPAGLTQLPVTCSALSPALVDALSSLSCRALPIFAPVCQALEHTALVVHVINENAHKTHFWDGDIDTTKLLGPAMHQALSIPRMGFDSPCARSPAGVLCELVRLALLLLLARIKKAFSLMADESVLLQDKFLDLLPFPSGTVKTNPKLALWCLTIVACSYTGTRPLSLTHATRDCMALLSIPTGSGAIQAARSMIWVDAVMTAEAKDLARDIDSLLNISRT